MAPISAARDMIADTMRKFSSFKSGIRQDMWMEGDFTMANLASCMVMKHQILGYVDQSSIQTRFGSLCTSFELILQV